MNLTIFKNTFMRGYKLILIFIFILCLYQTTIISVIDVDDFESVKQLFGSVGELVKIFGIDISQFTSPLNFTASTFFSVLVLAFTMVLYMISVNSLILKPVEDSSLACTLSAPIKRRTLVITKGVFLILELLILFSCIFIDGVIMLSRLGDFEVIKYFYLVLIAYLLCSTIAMMSYFLSICFCGTKLGFPLTVGVPILMLFMQMMAGVGGEKTEWLSNITPFGWLNSMDIVTGQAEPLPLIIIFSIMIIILLFLSVVVFNRKRLPI